MDILASAIQPNLITEETDMSTPRTSLTLILTLAAIAAPALLSPPTAHAGWDQTEKLLANDGEAGDDFGT